MCSIKPNISNAALVLNLGRISNELIEEMAEKFGQLSSFR